MPDTDSFSTHLLNKFLEYYKAKNPTDVVEIIDLNNLPMAAKTMTSGNLAMY